MSDKTTQTAFAVPAPLTHPLSVPLTNVIASQRRVLRANAARKRTCAVSQRISQISTATASGVPSPPEDTVQNPFVASERDAVLLDPEDQEFVEWAVSPEREDGDIVTEEEEELPLESILNLDSASNGKLAGLDEDDELDISAGFPDEDDDDDEGIEDEDDDEELAARAGTEEFDDDTPLASLRKRGDRLSVPASTPLDGVEGDDNDDVGDEVDIMDPVSDGISSIFDDEVDIEDDADSAGQAVLPTEAGDAGVAPFDGSDEDIQSAADILSSSGLLGLGVDGAKRDDVSAVTSFALGDSDTIAVTAETGVEKFSKGDMDDVSNEDLEIEDDGKEEDENSSEEDGGLDSYVDGDEDDDDEFTLTSRASFGRVWELNDDNYVTITEPGQSYAYELDEEDEEDQEMSTVRRGKQGGWSGGLASYSSAQLPEGSKEWVARRAYELVANSSPTEMFKWTRQHKGPPPVIDELYPSDPPAPPKLGRTTLYFSTPGSSTPIIGTDSSSRNEDDEEYEDEGPPTVTIESSIQDRNALERAVKFPCQYKFKVEGGGMDDGDNFEKSLAADLETILKRPVSSLGFQVEPAGRYKRVVMKVNVESAQQVTEVYDALRNNPAVKFSFG